MDAGPTTSTPITAAESEQEIATGRRFAFGANWSAFLLHLDEERIAEAVRTMVALLGMESLAGLRFLDAGSGSGLFSLAARRLGADVVSFDFDPRSVACTEELRRRYNLGGKWEIMRGSVLDEAFLAGLGRFDVVYSWGVLHHTGDQWRAIDLVTDRVAVGGSLVLALYRDEGWRSRAWGWAKRRYCAGGRLSRGAVLAATTSILWWRPVISGLLRHGNPLYHWHRYRQQRGMSPWHDLVDWAGGYPFEVSRPGQVVDAVVRQGLLLRRLTEAQGNGCDQYVFTRVAD